MEKIQLDRPRLYVDFSEMLENDLVLLSQEDSKIDSSGNLITFQEGQEIYVYMDDPDVNGSLDYLIAHGAAVRTMGKGWASAAEWCCRIDKDGIKHLSEIQK